jgi:hypothetical protein
MRLHGYETRRSGGTLELELYWQAVTRSDLGLTRLLGTPDDPSGSAIGAQPLALTDFLPTDQWPDGQVVIERAQLAMPGSGPIVLRVGWARPSGVADTIDITVSE